MSNRYWQRRDFLQFVALGAVSLGATQVLGSADDCTASGGFLGGDQPLGGKRMLWEGPFWREDAPFSAELFGEHKQGTFIEVSGRILDAKTCQPVPGAVLDIWHASPTGRYYNADEFQGKTGHFRGQVRTDGKGQYSYRTLIPGNYRVGGVLRAQHVHLRVYRKDKIPFVTQMFFADDKLLKSDPLEIATPELVCKPVAVAKPAGSPFEKHTVAKFDLILPS